MINVIVLFPKPSDAKNIRNVLMRSGIDVTAVCTSGSQVISRIGDLNEGLIVCGYKYTDMIYHELREYLPKEFEMLVIASRVHWEELQYQDIYCLSMPIKVYALVEQVQQILEKIVVRKRKQKKKLKERTPEQKALIEEAKSIIMQNNGMTEAEAHSYLQKYSMDSGMNMVETAKMILEVF
ncbi:MAG: ANTAR domain-containing protein [Lachnospiraceae bacterium]|nr:ANTAR domain-containing protein [Lachnospiraceae bacterium]